MVPTFTRVATLEDARYVAANLRDADRDEVEAVSGGPPELVLPLMVDGRRAIWAAGLQLDGRAEILYGRDPVPGVPRAIMAWVLTTPRVYQYAPTFLVRMRDIFEEWRQDYDVMTNFIDARNVRHQRWLTWMGFHALRRVEKFGAHSLPFIEFAYVKPPSCA